jgi:hypothetical protein
VRGHPANPAHDAVGTVRNARNFARRPAKCAILVVVEREIGILPMAMLAKSTTNLLAALAVLALPVAEAAASQGPGVGPGTATMAEQIWLAVGLAAAVLTIIVLDRRGRR